MAPSSCDLPQTKMIHVSQDTSKTVSLKIDPSKYGFIRVSVSNYVTHFHLVAFVAGDNCRRRWFVRIAGWIITGISSHFSLMLPTIKTDEDKWDKVQLQVGQSTIASGPKYNCKWAKVQPIQQTSAHCFGHVWVCVMCPRGRCRSTTCLERIDETFENPLTACCFASTDHNRTSTAVCAACVLPVSSPSQVP